MQKAGKSGVDICCTAGCINAAVTVAYVSLPPNCRRYTCLPILSGDSLCCNLGQQGSGERAQPDSRCTKAEF